MRYLSVCSGIEAASVAWHSLGWTPVAFAEIDKFASAVLAHHYPHVPNLGDFTKIEAADVGAIDLLVGGTPCQSFSVAGKRRGLDDPRGNLALEFCRLARRLRPRWVVWENVVGVHSQWSGAPDDSEIPLGGEWRGDEDSDFGAFLDALEECGYSACWRVLDAQYVRVDSHPRAVPQRRERVFLVGYLGDWRPAAAVLLEPEGLRGDSPPRRQARQAVAGSLGAGSARSGGRVGRRETAANHLVAGTLGRRSVDHPSGLKSEADFLVAFADPICANEARTYTHEGENNFRLRNVVPEAWAVRRLTPRECERLMGDEDDFTLIPYRGKPAADGPRYKALGNSMAKNCMRWIGQRIAMFERVRLGLDRGAAA